MNRRSPGFDTDLVRVCHDFAAKGLSTIPAEVSPSLPLTNRLPRSFYDRPTSEVARDLIGKALLHHVDGCWRGGWIVETEAYLHQRDPASHSARGPTRSNASMFEAPGTLYVYPIHAKYCLNAVTQAKGEGTAVLIRAIEPVWGVESMRIARGIEAIKRLTSGPAMLCQALSVSRDDDGRCLIQDPRLGIFTDDNRPASKVATTKRIGISKAVDRKLRFVDSASRFLSRPYRDPRSKANA
ncbi:MAG: DNA-3-methyladenine glycosylase [Planctomycetota bacterium]